MPSFSIADLQSLQKSFPFLPITKSETEKGNRQKLHFFEDELKFGFEINEGLGNFIYFNQLLYWRVPVAAVVIVVAQAMLLLVLLASFFVLLPNVCYVPG